MLAAGRHLLSAIREPSLHHLDLVDLRQLDAQRELLHNVAAAAGAQEIGHLDRLRVMADHPLHELDVGADVLHLRKIDRLLGADHPRRLARSARLDDGRTRLNGSTASGAARRERDQRRKQSDDAHQVDVRPSYTSRRRSPLVARA